MKPGISSEPGWLSPEGGYYSFDSEFYDHTSLALYLLNTVLDMPTKLGDELHACYNVQTKLLEEGFLRIDYEEVNYVTEPTFLQLHKLQLIKAYCFHDHDDVDCKSIIRAIDSFVADHKADKLDRDWWYQL